MRPAPSTIANALALAAFERLAVDRAVEVDRDAIGVLRFTLDRMVGRSLLAQVLDHRIDVAVATSAVGRSICELLDAASSICGTTSNTARYLRSPPCSRLIGSMRGPPAGVSFSCTTASAKRRLHDVAQHFLADLLAELLPHDLDRDLARAEALQAHRAAQLLQPLVDRLFDVLGGNLDFHPALERAGRLYRNLHGLNDLCEGLRVTGESPRRLLVRKEGLEPSRGLPTGT